MSSGLERLYNHFVPGYSDPVPRSGDPSGEGVPLLTPELLQEIRAQRVAEPEAALERARRAIGGVETLEDLDENSCSGRLRKLAS